MGDWVGGSIFLHGPPLSDLLMGTTEAHGSECLNRDNDSRPLFAALKRRQTRFLSQFVFACLSCVGGHGRSVWTEITVVKRPQHTDESWLSLGAAKCFGEQRCSRGVHGEGQAASEQLQVGLGLPPGVDCPQVPPCAHVSPLRHVPPCTEGQGSPAGHVLPLSLPLGGWCAG